MSITQMEMRGCIRQEQRLQPTRIRKNIFRHQLVLKAGAIPFRRRQPAPFLQPCLLTNTMAELKNQGKSLSETIAAKPTAAYDTKWGQFLMTPAIFTGLVYSGV